MGITEDGIKGELWLLNVFEKKGIPTFQGDVMSLENNAYILNEIKNQEFYTTPPFDGHGLPLWQTKARMAFFNKTGIRCRLVVLEKGTSLSYWQWLDILENKEFYDTNGGHPRRIYPLKNFSIDFEGNNE